ncbi:MAG: PspC domain-containing protein [Woeseiaceae bacterium]|nr:PspC domain-containing protein [Woeseiaceae bacterium]
MTAYVSTQERRFTRDADRGVVAGVCAGIADYFGFRPCAVRLIFIIALFVAFPFAALTYLAIVLLVPAESSRYEYVVEREVIHRRRRRRRRMSRRERRRAEAEEREQEEVRRAEKVRERYRSLDERLARIEKYVTSSRYDLDREFRNL